MVNFFYTTSNYDNKDIFWDILDTLKDKDRDKDKDEGTDLVISWLNDTVDYSWQIEEF